MNTTHWRRAPLAAGCCAALAALTLAAAGATAATAGTRAAASGSGGAPIVTTDDGAVRGTTAGTVDEFLGIPYAAPPTGNRQQVLAASMRAAWANFAARGNPATRAVPWPAISANSTRMLSLVPPQPQVETDFTARHHCAFWAAG